MPFTFGFYNAVNHDRLYDAEDVSSMFDGIILDGIYMHVGNRFIVKAKEELDDTVIIGSGRAWFNHTWSLLDTDTAMKGPKSDVVRNRIDAIVIDVDRRDNARRNQLLWITGEYNGQRPTLIKADGHYQYPLCYIERRASTKAIHQADITNMVGTSASPFVTGVLQGMDIDDLIAQWLDQWNRVVVKYQEETIAWRNEKIAEINKYTNEFKLQMDEFRTVETKKFLDWKEAEVKAFEQWKNTEFTSYNEWLNGLKVILNENVAGNLLNLINNTNEAITNITETEFLRYYDLISSNTLVDDRNNRITMTNSEGTSVTTFSTSGNVDTIITVVTPNEGTMKYTQTTTITALEGDQTRIVSNYTKSPK